MGKPVIATAYSGNLDFMTRDNSFLVDFERVALERDHGVYKKDNIWAEPSIEHAAHYMRQVFEDQDTAHALGQRAAAEMQRLLATDAAGRRMAQRLEVIEAAQTKSRALAG
jgi:hypothetical protein